MNRQLLNKWIKALRSDEYKQGGGLLKNSRDEYCCLGVLLDITNNEIVPATGFPTGKQCKRLGLPSPGLFGEDKTITNKLAKFNDSGRSFKWIASYLERYPHKVLDV